MKNKRLIFDSVEEMVKNTRLKVNNPKPSITPITFGDVWKTTKSLLIVFAIIAIAVGVLDVKSRYAVWYNVARENVTIDQKPHDCDWSTAPLGNKNCHYDKVMTFVRTGIDRAHRPVISFDEGKTWGVDCQKDGIKKPDGTLEVDAACITPVLPAGATLLSVPNVNDSSATPVADSILVSSVHVSWQKVEE
jgi:hypothetical protein